MNPFDFSQPLILEDHVVQLRPLQTDDFALLKQYAAVRSIWTYSSIRLENEADLKNYIQLAMDEKETCEEYPFIVFDKRTGTYAGSTRYYDIQPKKDTLQLGYTWYGPRFHGTGLNKHCKYLLLQFAFETLGMLRVEFRAHAGNRRSLAAMKSIGCTVEGTLRSNQYSPDGTRRDTTVLSILKNEWENGVRERLAQQLLPAGT